jgi:CheY-like chemotaxis protein
MAATQLVVLIVDDEPLVGQMIASLVKRVGHTAVVVESPAAALEAAAQHSIGLVVTDMQMPDGDGVALCEELVRLYPGVPIIAMSGSGETSRHSHLQRALRAGARTTLAKPFRLDDFYKVMGATLGADQIVGQTGR